MSKEEEAELTHLREQLDSANRDARQNESYLSTELNKSHDEARLYRGLFWLLLTLASVASILNILQR